MSQNNGSSHRKILQRIAREAMYDKGFQVDFDDKALAAAQKLHESEIKLSAPIKDLRELVWCSIDNDDSEDLDQLSVAIKMPSGSTKILIAVADVDAVADKESAFEPHANHNTTSVYTSALIFPMLPEKLSTDLTSLKFNADRLAIVVEYTLDIDGTMQESDVYRAVVHNKAKLAYNSLGAWMENGEDMPTGVKSVQGLAENLKLQQEVASKLKKQRYQNGALYLETPEAKAVFEKDAVSDLRVEQKNEAKDIIQEFMIAANGVVVRFLGAGKFPTIRRIVRIPKRWDRIVVLASDWKYNLPAVPDSKALDEFLLKSKNADPDRFPDLSLSVIKLLRSGEYAVEVPGEPAEGHFGLAVKNYTHSTAPNRRYPDLITQRLLKALLAGNKVPYSIDTLRAIASNCTIMEDSAKKVERQVEKSTAALLFGSRIGGQYDGIVTGANEKGTWARVLHPPVEGKIVKGFEGLDVGDRVRVQLVRTDVERGFIDFKRV